MCSAAIRLCSSTLAAASFKVLVYNFSEQSESSELIGGFRPVDVVMHSMTECEATPLADATGELVSALVAPPRALCWL